MQLGSGLHVKPVKAREYLYVWHYEVRDGRRRPVYEYIGPAADLDSGRRAAEALEAHARRAVDDARRRVRTRRTEAVAVSR